MRRITSKSIIIVAVVACIGWASATPVFFEETPQQSFLHEAYTRIYREKIIHGNTYIKWMSDRVQARLSRTESNETRRALQHLSNFLDLQKGTATGAVMLPEQSTWMNKEQFFAVYGPYVTSDNPLPERCFDRYNEIDKIARKNNVPTELIIASRYKEAGCNMLNPWNGDGLFQIVSHDYGTGAIGVPELLEQTQHFIDFCYAKRAVYKKVRRFDDVPVQITYEGRSLQDLRKQSVLYNGMYAAVTLENSRYANNGFAGYARPEYSSQDGLVTLVLKVLAHQYGYK